jgi:hypothetical protein
MREAARLLATTALLVGWLNLRVQVGGTPGDGLDPRVLAARVLLCYVAAFWLGYAWSAARTTLGPGRLAPPPAPPTGT